MNIVIAGFGVAGATAAEEARKLDSKAYITIFSKEKDLFYYRPRLPEVVSGDLSPDKVIAHPKSWYDERRIEVRLGESLAEVNPAEKIVRGSMGSRQTYDAILLAIGAESNRPPFPGDKLGGIYAVRSLHDAWSLYFYAKDKKRAVLIGGGILGLEMGCALTKLGLSVVVLERAKRILPRQTTPASAELLRKKMSALGVEFLLETEAARFEGSGGLENVVLKNGGDLPAEAALISAGVTPNLGLAKVLGLKIDRAIVVDEYMETSLPGVYAAGDCAQFPGAAGGLWTTSREQALTAGFNIATKKPAERKIYVPKPPSSTLKVAGIDLVAAGNIDPDGLMRGVEAANETTYRKVVVDAAGRLAGFTVVGESRGVKELNAALTAGKILAAQTLEALTAPDFDFARL
ncbi:MAG: FAD-dependent oxidoreductase [Candidatus Adiutrix sp.]|jgi:nitrite reductase (NADH) large subunit|nr:FAD-dependent oxidoreductase [Candidatus Adiutrix sp.]